MSSTNIPEITIDTGLRARLQAGHPWIYRNHVLSGSERLRSGQWVRIRCGSWSAYGLWDAQSAIAVRIFARQSLPDASWIGERIWEAWEGRAALRDATPATSAYRWLYGEGDGVPGIVVDRYSDYAIIQTYAESLQTVVPLVASALRGSDPELRGVVLRPGRQTTQGQEHEREPEGDEQGNGSPNNLHLLWGEMPPADLVVQEHGLYFRADLRQGQKTGLFLDQRENRRSVEALAGGRSVLNCFAYTGGFSLYALRGGAASVQSVDLGRGLAEAASDNLRLNRMDQARHRFITEDCFALLDTYAKAGNAFQLVILDPPSFARAKSSLHAAIRAYTRLNSLALRVVEDGGLLVTASCTSQISPEQFRSLLGDAASQASRRVQIIHEAGQPVDHPVPTSFPEGRYLKFIVARVLPAL